MTSAAWRATVVVLALCLAGVLVGGCAATGSGGLDLENVYSRPAPAGGMGGAFVTVTNGGDTPDRLIGARTSVAEAVELHETIDDNGVMKMRPVAGGIEIPPGKTVELKPGGMHVMLMGLTAPLVEGQDVELTLIFEKAGPVTLKVPVKLQ